MDVEKHGFEVQSDEKSQVERLFFFVWKWKMSILETKHLNSSSRAPFSTEPWIRMLFLGGRVCCSLLKFLRNEASEAMMISENHLLLQV